MEGTIHPYYTVALAPAIAALVAIGARALWRERTTLTGRLGLVAIVVAAGGWSYVLLGRTSSWHPELRYLVAAATVLSVVGLLVPMRRLAGAVVTAGLVAGLLGTGAFAAATAATAHTGSIPSVGPAAASSATGGMGGGMGGTGDTGGAARAGGTKPTGTMPSGTVPSGTRPTGSASTSGAASTGDASTSSAALTKALKVTTTTWAAAVAGDQSAAELELSTGKAVIAIGGWSGSDNSPTLAQFEQYVAEGKISYFLTGTGQAGGQSGGVATQIAAWVKAHFTATTVGGQTVYDLTHTATS